MSRCNGWHTCFTSERYRISFYVNSLSIKRYIHCTPLHKFRLLSYNERRFPSSNSVTWSSWRYFSLKMAWSKHHIFRSSSIYKLALHCINVVDCIDLFSRCPFKRNLYGRQRHVRINWTILMQLRISLYIPFILKIPNTYSVSEY